MKSKRNICILTGTRAEYGLLRTLMRAVAAHPRLELQVVATGTHLLKEFGRSVDQIRADGFQIAARLHMYKTAADVRRELPASLARLTDQLGRWMLAHNSDCVVVLGDRVEALGGALAGLTANIPIAHLHGGELAAGDMDDRIRFAISALAALHFVSTCDARDRLIRGGEPADRIHVVGALGMDEILAARRAFDARCRRDCRRAHGLPLDRPVLVVLHHPCGFGEAQEYRHMKAILRTVESHDGIVIGPNNDPGHSGLRRALAEFFARGSTGGRWRFFENLGRDDFLRAVAAADLLVGNSSSGILEANALGTAVVNIGPRQAGRRRNGNAVFDCSQAGSALHTAVRRALAFSRSHAIHSLRQFGVGRAGQRIADTLAAVALGRDLTVKPRR